MVVHFVSFSFCFLFVFLVVVIIIDPSIAVHNRNIYYSGIIFKIENFLVVRFQCGSVCLYV